MSQHDTKDEPLGVSPFLHNKSLSLALWPHRSVGLQRGLHWWRDRRRPARGAGCEPCGVLTMVDPVGQGVEILQFWYVLVLSLVCSPRKTSMAQAAGLWLWQLCLWLW